MCGRYTLKEDLKELEGYFEGSAADFEYRPNYNVAPTHEMPIVFQDTESNNRQVQSFRWGLLPFWATEKKVSYSMINARGESVDTKKSFKTYFKSQRCLIPASGFYEWKGKKGNKTPFYIQPTEEPLFAFAGIYSLWKEPSSDKIIPNFSIITTEANKPMKELHHRMPAMLFKEEWQQWLAPQNEDTNELKELIRPYLDDGIEFYQVSKQVNNVKNNSSELLNPSMLF